MLGNQVTSKQKKNLTTVAWQHCMQAAGQEEQKWAKYEGTYWVSNINLLLCIRNLIDS